jgi:type IV secretory pathway protease TraF
VAAIGGDIVRVSALQTTVNGTPIPRSARRVKDSLGRPLSAISIGQFELAPGEIWLLTNHHPRSWDSRYFGPVPVANIQGRLCPLWQLDRMLESPFPGCR